MPVTNTEIEERDAKRDLAAELLQSVREMTAGEGTALGQFAVPEAAEARHRTGLSQARFAQLLGVSKRTLQGWEQGRRKPTGAASTLLKVAKAHPEVLRELDTPTAA
ncbi:helix-turn-helix domain-containing protein [Cupriavidus sp. CuC1]|uniref:helix-turn-helix domain-containing protein n=1 Tax=Cupriavidus sp. CuC1 TaxID=3373131 RepID=UPI0037CD1D1C